MRLIETEVEVSMHILLSLKLIQTKLGLMKDPGNNPERGN